MGQFCSLRLGLFVCIFLLAVGFLYSVSSFNRNQSLYTGEAQLNINTGRKVQSSELKFENVLSDREDKVARSLPWYPELEVLPVAPDPEWTDPRRQLIPGMVPPIVHYIWCGMNTWFEFKHYLAIKSISRWIKPDRIVFHYIELPVIDKLHYNQWFDELKHNEPFFETVKMNQTQSRYCGGDRNTQVRIILDILREEGGIFIGPTTWILEFPAILRLRDLIYALEPSSTQGFMLLRGGLLRDGNDSYHRLLKDNRYKSQTYPCANLHHLYKGAKNITCLIIEGQKFKSFSPMNVWELDDPFGKITRKLYYGTEKIIRPKPSYEELVPNIGHMIWIGGGPMNFVFYLSVLSLLHVVEVDTVYIHGDKEPAGEYWQQLRNNTRIKFITRLPPYNIYQGVIEPYYRALMSDIIRVDLMIKYGGVYTDTDAIWVKPLSLKDRGYEAVAAFDWVDWSYPFPDSVNFGLSYGKKNAPFWRIFRESMRELHNELHGFTGVMNPYKILEKYPNLIRIDPHLQVICYQQKCHPTYVNDYHNMSKNHENMKYLQNWSEDVNAFHWTHPDPPEYKNMETLLSTNSMFADLGKHVLRKAGIIK